MNCPVAAVTKRDAVVHIESQLGVIPVRLDVMRVEFNVIRSTLAAHCFIPADNRVDPLVMRATAILAPSSRAVVRMRFARMSKPALIRTSLGAELLLL